MGAFIVIILGGCVLSTPSHRPVYNPDITKIVTVNHTNSDHNGLPLSTRPPKFTPPPTRKPGQPILTPTPDAPRTLPTLRETEEVYTVTSGDTLFLISKRYGVPLSMLIEANNLANPDILEVGQVLTIPAPEPTGTGPAYKIIPDSELVYGPMTVFFDMDDFVRKSGGYLSSYREVVDDFELQGSEIIYRVSREFSVNPRLLLALLEHQSGWVSKDQVSPFNRQYPLGYPDKNREGLWRQLNWAANQLNYGYYTWKANVLPAFYLTDGAVILPSVNLNAATIGVQHFFAQLHGLDQWESNVSFGGFSETYHRMFGYPFDLAIEPLLPDDLEQPNLQLPFESGVTWSFTGGPHGGWGDGSAWAALDFAPPGEAPGCVSSDEWVTAAASGLVTYSGDGIVIIDLDEDGFAQTGWTLFYLHIEARDRIPANTRVLAGDRIGHPSCEGGLSSGTHVHIARRYNGEWIEAAGEIPFVMDSWEAQSSGELYNGYLVKDGYVIEAWDRRMSENQIQR